MIKCRHITAFLAIITSLWTQQSHAENHFNAYGHQFIENYVDPQVAAFSQSAIKLDDTIAQLCQQNSSAHQQAFRTQFSSTVAALARVDFLRLGPLNNNSLAQRINFFPDKRGVTQRQLNKVFAKQDSSVTTAERLARKSVALQGMGTLEKIAFDKDGALILGKTATDAPFRCSFAQAIGTRLVVSATELEKEWQNPKGYRLQLLEPDAQKPNLKSHQEAAEAIFNALITALIVNKDQIVLPAIGKSARKNTAYKAPFARSHNSVLYLSTSLEAIQSALTTSGFLNQLTDEQAWVADSLRFETQNGVKTLAKLKSSFKMAAKDANERKQLVYLNIVIGSLRETMATTLAGYLGLAGGFNSLDGD
ncbi:imelysin family protein [Polycladidibacter stylochi]|uniref:imelysin family protein n=1 Tax=Polycladidibacter stylochi TaxID=1807766 RepID=UPI00082B35C3|nr:imelysin family protein [Pseudovibrio stylochi]